MVVAFRRAVSTAVPRSRNLDAARRIRCLDAVRMMNLTEAAAKPQSALVRVNSVVKYLIIAALLSIVFVARLFTRTSVSETHSESSAVVECRC